MAIHSPLLLSGGNLTAMQEMEAVQQQLFDETTEANASVISSRGNEASDSLQMSSSTPQEPEVSTVHSQSNTGNITMGTEQITRSASPVTGAVSLQSQPSAVSSAPEAEYTSEEAPIVQNESIAKSNAPKSAIVSSEVEIDPKVARRLRRQKLIKECAVKRAERRRLENLMNPKVQSKSLAEGYKPTRKLTAEEKEKMLMVSANSQITSSLKRRYSWIVDQPDITEGRSESRQKYLKNEVKEKEVDTEGQAQSTLSQTIPSSERRHTIM